MIARYILAKVWYVSAERALNFLYYQDDTGLYEHSFIPVSLAEDFKQKAEEISSPGFKETRKSLFK